MVKATVLVGVYYAGLLAIVAAPWMLERHTHTHTATATASQSQAHSQYWYVQRLDDGRVLVGCENGTSADPADATIEPTDIQSEIIVSCGTREADAK
jgi:hypothetical protein